MLALSVSSSSAARADTYVSVTIDAQGQLTIRTKEGRHISPAREKDQVGFSSARMSPDGRAVGWLADFPNCCTSYPIALKLVIYSNGRTQTFVGSGLPIAKWMFRDGGRRIAFEQETVHGEQGINYELWDLPSNRQVDGYSPQYDRDLQLLPNQRGPQWVQELDALQ
jgi:hypothetical protein